MNWYELILEKLDAFSGVSLTLTLLPHRALLTPDVVVMVVMGGFPTINDSVTPTGYLTA